MRLTTLLLLAAFLAAPAAAEGYRSVQNGTGQYTSSPLPLSGNEQVSFTVTPPAGKIRLADSFKFEVKASLPENYSLKPDTSTPADSGFELLSFAKSGETKEDGRKTETFEIKAQAFTLGISTFPAISWRLAGTGAPDGAKALSPSFTLEVLPLFKTKEGEGIRDIYPPFRYLPWHWLSALALAAAAAYYLYRRIRGGAGGAAHSAWLDPRSPYQRARDRLGKLEKSPLAAAGRLKEFYTGLASVLRLYLTEEFSIDAALMTTSVLGRELKRTGAGIKTALRARELLQKSDLVKFARLKPEDAADDSRALEELLTEFHQLAGTQKQPGGKP
ncbi:MAG: hypothetical protein AAB359_04030 [Elusimicrobiota bacterium]